MRGRARASVAGLTCIKVPGDGVAQSVHRGRPKGPPRGRPHMRLTVRTNLALRTLMVCAANPDRIVRKA
jgi:hypothetical protein